MPASVYEMTVIGFLIVVALYIGQVVLVPLALAVILAFVLAPPVRMLRRTGIGNTASVFVVVGIEGRCHG
jgi:predicted PurR-regulated permease PerM